MKKENGIVYNALSLNEIEKNNFYIFEMALLRNKQNHV
ncbi:hypothetical protein LEP1GSC194_2092 [Leptospira alstonii serovar Sichuan str. 79601]|uniref:Uncharacterized protein n=1 Tax=Leptospira alstonii serovar Sichuan str. 79601 TaxID=1218565 RepID=M6D1F6_9LEPT|nr:hypothetical protein LEP1GSC194_2092 [Leptospira alstonii serovar Sichuan str. 79601]